MSGKRKVKKSAVLVRITSLIDIRAIRIEGIILIGPSGHLFIGSLKRWGKDSSRHPIILRSMVK
jgi:hypothetical protein